MVGVDRSSTLLFFLPFAFLISGVSVNGWTNVVGSAAKVASLVGVLAARLVSMYSAPARGE
jgi:uncharacterized membrane protein